MEILFALNEFGFGSNCCDSGSDPEVILDTQHLKQISRHSRAIFLFHLILASATLAT